MLRKLRLLSVLLVIGLCAGASAELISYHPFDEGAGTTAVDASGHGNDGTLSSGVEWVEGYQGGAVHLDTAGERIVLNGFDPSAANNAMTLAAWINWEGNGNSITHQGIIGKRQGWDPRTNVKWFWEAQPDGDITMRNGDAAVTASGALLPHENEWIHVAMTWDASAVVQYINGEEINSGTQTFRTTADATVVSIGSVSATNSETFVGSIDEARIYDTALTPIEILQAMKGDTTSASAPQPADSMTDVRRDGMLSWAAGEFANTHTVYFSASLADVNEGAAGALISEGLAETASDPGRLAFDETYYWRVDEVNSAPDFTVYNGEIWSFTVEPEFIPIDNVTATASSSFGVSGAEKTVDGSGLVGDLHGSDAADMWISGGIPATIEYAFDRPYKLQEVWIWNSNQLIESFVGFGAKDVVIEYSADGENWTILEGVGPLAQGPGLSGYAANNILNFGGVMAQRVRVTVNSVQGIAPQASLSEVRFYHIPVNAREPQPANGAALDGVDAALSWRSGREAGRHEVYLDMDTASTLVATVEENSYLAAALELDSTYHWKIHEVNDAEIPTAHASDTWSFSTPASLSVDDMESYKDEEFFEIWATWVDGFEDPTNGSLVGADPAIGDFSPETGIVHAGSQSLPIWFDNSSAPVSEATRTFDQTQDWTRSGIQTLVLYFMRGADNTGGGVYLKINDTKVMYEGGAGILPPGWATWTQWNIDLSAVAGAASVRSMTIGVEGAGAMGVIYVDSIQLLKNAPPVFQPLSWFEAESGAITAPLQVFTDDATASAGEHIGTEDGIGNQNGDPPADGVATYSFDVPEDGVYRLAFRVIITGGSDSFWVRIPGMVTNTLNHASGWVRFNGIEPGDTWHWDEVHSWEPDESFQLVDFTLSAGTHTLEIAQREDGALLDAIALME
ncbi:MAG: hypothetical protein IIC50_10635 [Planctomycetes bacterium]|nr:hypothetical protein [Planctomycetota bacterium]